MVIAGGVTVFAAVAVGRKDKGREQQYQAQQQAQAQANAPDCPPVNPCP